MGKILQIPREGHHGVEALHIEIPGSSSTGVCRAAAPGGVTPETHPAPIFKVHVTQRDSQKTLQMAFFFSYVADSCLSA